MAVADRNGLPLAIHTTSASPAEVNLAGLTLATLFVEELPKRLIGGKAYDSDLLDEEMALVGIEMIAPNRANRSQAEDGRQLRRYKRRWHVERLFAWLFNFRRLVVRYERRTENFQAMAELGAATILLRVALSG